MNFDARLNVRVVKKLLCGASLGALATVIAGPSWAQPSQQPELATEQVTVTATGTMIKGINPVGANLVTMDSTDIKASGAVTTNEVLNQIPQIANTFNTQTVEPTAINIGGVRPSIRYNPAQTIVGGAATLVLLDGNNLVGVSGLATAPDPGFIPTVVLQRVDVMPDGASSIYGANAVTGVINFVTRNNFQGLETNASLGLADGYTAFDASAMAGTAWGDGGAYLAYEHKSNTYLMAADRDYTKMDLTSIGGRDSRSTQCALANLTAPGGKNYALTSSAVPNTAGALAANVTGPFGGLNPVTNAGSFNRCDTNSYASLFPKQEQNTIFGEFHQHVAEGVEFSTKLLWGTRLDSQLRPQLSAQSTINTTNPYFQSIAGETTQTVQFNFAPFYGNNAYNDWNSITVFQVVPRLTIDLPFKDWQLELIGNYGRSASIGFQRTVNTSLLNESMAQSVIGGTLSPALVASSGLAGNAVDPYNLNLGNPLIIHEILNNGQFGKAVQHQMQYQGAVNGTLFDLPGGPVKAAIGGKYSWEDYVANWYINWPIGQGAGAAAPGAQFANARPHRITEAGFTEVSVPIVGEANQMTLVKSFAIDASGRIDSYSDFGQTTNYKVGFTYDPFSALTIRGTKGTSYDAPSLADTSAPDTRFTYTPQRTTPNAIVPPGTSAADALRPSISSPGGNPNLGPELGNTWSIGGDFHPTTELGVDLTGLVLSLTFSHVKFEHQIGLTPFNNTNLSLFSGPYSQYYIINPTLAQIQARYQTAGVATIGFPGPDLASAFGPGVNPPFIYYDLRRNNLGNAFIEGFDFDASYTTNIEGFGTLTARAAGTINSMNDTQAAVTSPLVNIIKYGVPLSAYNISLQAVTGPLTSRVWVQYSPGFNNAPTSQSYSLYGQTRVGAFHPVNLYLGYDMSGLATWLSNSEASITVNNIGNDDPPVLLAGGTAQPSNGGTGITAAGSTLGRYIVLSLQKQF
jgi:iron complex outermembrane receptor protein